MRASIIIIMIHAAASALILSWGREARAETTGASFRAGTEFFVLNKFRKDSGTWMFLVTPADNPAGGYWISSKPGDQRFSYLAADEDLLAYDVAHPANARYLKAKEPIENARKDDKQFAKLTEDPHWRDKFFRRLEDNIPMTGVNVVNQAKDTDRVCPAHPQMKSGKPCAEMQAKKLPDRLKKMIRDSALKHGLPPALLAALIQYESDYDFWLENTGARQACEHDRTKCSKYKWERGLGQLGAEVSRAAGVNWEVSVGKPSECEEESLTDSCIMALETTCREYRIRHPNQKLSPYNCPAAAIEAVAFKLQSTRDQQANQTLHPAELAKHLQPSGGGLEAWRNVVGAYNRGPRVANAYEEFHRQTGRYPQSYGQVWAIQRQDSETPSSKGVGYYLLNKEYINRCYVYGIVGICGGLTDQSLARQFAEQVGSDLLEGTGSRRGGGFRRTLARE